MKYVFTMLVMCGVFNAPVAWGTNCKVHKIYCKIVKLQPSIDKTYAMELSNHISRKAKKYNINPMISVAILNQENRFRNQHTWKTTKNGHPECTDKTCTMTIVEVKEVKDMGVAQINVNTASHYGFDLTRLFEHDMEYAIDCHFNILKNKINMCSGIGEDAWSCYHSTTPKHRLKYVAAVSRYL